MRWAGTVCRGGVLIGGKRYLRGQGYVRRLDYEMHYDGRMYEGLW